MFIISSFMSDRIQPKKPLIASDVNLCMVLLKLPSAISQYSKALIFIYLVILVLYHCQSQVFCWVGFKSVVCLIQQDMFYYIRLTLFKHFPFFWDDVSV